MAFIPKGRITLPPIEGRSKVSALLGHTEYNSVIFFENSAEQKGYIAAYCPTVQFARGSFDEVSPDANFIIVDIQETEPPPLVPFDKLPFKDELVGNKYVERFDFAARSDRFDAVAGIQQRHYDNILKPWIASRGIGPHIAVFDWDRTITVIEGIYPVSDIIEDALNYVCGGTTRVAMLRQMFQELVDKNIHIMILTNNTGGRRPEFDMIIRSLVGADKPAYSIVVSYGEPYDGIKVNAFSKMVEFRKLACGAPAPRPRAPPPPPPRLLPSGNENLYGELNNANKEVAYYAGLGGRRTKRRRGRRGTRRLLRKMMKRMLRNSTKGRSCKNIIKLRQ